MNTLIEILIVPKETYADSDYVYAQKINGEFTPESPALVINLDKDNAFLHLPRGYEYVISALSLTYGKKECCNISDKECSHRWAVKFINKINQVDDTI